MLHFISYNDGDSHDVINDDGIDSGGTCAVTNMQGSSQIGIY